MKILNYNNLPIYYYWNKSVWMQISIFNEILLTLNKNINLLIDNAPLHMGQTATKPDK